MGNNSGSLFGQEAGRVNNLCFQSNFLICSLTIGYFDHFPISISHRITSILDKYYW